MSTESAAATDETVQISQTVTTEASDDVLATENQGTDAKADDVDDDLIPTGDEGSTASEEKASTESEETVPESYADFDLPEGIEMNPSYMEKLGPVFKELGLTQPQAQKLINAHVDHVQATAGQGAEAFEKMKAEWLQEAKTDKEIGGDKFQQTAVNANRAVNELGTPALKELLKSYGIGQHPEVIRVFSKIGGFLGEDKPGSFKVNASPEKKDTATRLYPDD
jgi:hypothetical protein